MPIWGQSDSNPEKEQFHKEWHDWCRSENLEGMRIALSEGQTVDEILSPTFDQMHAASICGRYGLMSSYEFLKENGADFMKPDGASMTCFIWAAQEGHLKMVSRLIGRFEIANLIQQKDESGQNGLHKACRRGQTTVVEAIIAAIAKAGLKIDDYKDINGQTAMHAAMPSGSPKVVKLLLQAGASGDIEDLEGKPPAKVRGAHSVCRQVLTDGDDSSNGMFPSIGHPGGGGSMVMVAGGSTPIGTPPAPPKGPKLP